MLPIAGLLLSLSLVPYQVDDAYITYRYAQNFSAGEGLVYNPGDAASEGFTSPLWFLLLSLGARILPMELLPFFSTFLGLLAYLGVLLVLARSSRAEPQVVRLLAMLALALWPGMVFYASTGMETLLFVLCVLVFQCAAMGLLSRQLGLAAAFLAISIRPEGGWLIAALLLSFLPFSELRKQLFSKRIVCQVTALIVGGALLTGVRWLLFADIFPNTFYAKLPDFMEGLDYLKGFALSWPGAMLTALALMGALLGEVRHRAFFLAALAWMVAPVLEGGDWMPHDRFPAAGGCFPGHGGPGRGPGPAKVPAPRSRSPGSGPGRVAGLAGPGDGASCPAQLRQVGDARDVDRQVGRGRMTSLRWPAWTSACWATIRGRGSSMWSG